MLQLNKLYCEDCLEGMKRIPECSVDMILCDLPYGTTVLKWDHVLSFEKIWEQYKRIIKPNGAIVLFGKEPFSSMVRSSNLDWYKYDWVWEKDTKSNFFQANYQPLNHIENIMVFSKAYAREIKDKIKMKYHPQFSDGKPYKIPKTSTTTSIFSVNHKNGKFEHKEKDTSKRFPNVILKFNTDKERFHPTQKPVALFEYLIRTYTNECDIVLDNCMGSGTTAVACTNTNRNWIGFEMSSEYCKIAEKRIADAVSKL